MHNQQWTPIQYLLVLIGIFVGIAVVYLLFRVCSHIEDATGESAYTPVKIGIIAAVPVVFTALGFFHISLPTIYMIVGTAICAVGVIIWNLMQFGVRGILFSLLHIILGVFAGVGVASLIIVIVVGGILYFVVGSSGGGSSTAGSTPSHVRDVATGQSFYVDKGVNGMLYLPERGDRILRPSDVSGRYHDDYGNDYVSC